MGRGNSACCTAPDTFPVWETGGRLDMLSRTVPTHGITKKKSVEERGNVETHRYHHRRHGGIGRDHQHEDGGCRISGRGDLFALQQDFRQVARGHEGEGLRLQGLSVRRCGLRLQQGVRGEGRRGDGARRHSRQQRRHHQGHDLPQDGQGRLGRRAQDQPRLRLQHDQTRL